ncbi:MAG: FeoB-associated Cys-rich membrane protein [Desulfurivibrio sp.]|nr:FeoB-associated Cys-rich membrane protein [Desulfurivibrio sp.]
MWQNIIIIFIIAACLFFIGRRVFRQFTGKQTGCGGSCGGCKDTSAQSDSCKSNTDFPKKTDA